MKSTISVAVALSLFACGSEGLFQWLDNCGAKEQAAALQRVAQIKTGLNDAYISGSESATFGARGFADYLALLLWGLSSDVGSRTLTDLGGKENSEEPRWRNYPTSDSCGSATPAAPAPT